MIKNMLRFIDSRLHPERYWWVDKATNVILFGNPYNDKLPNGYHGPSGQVWLNGKWVNHD